MDIWSNLMMGFQVAVTPMNLVFALVGAFLGTIIGALPGIGSTSGVALLLPLTFGMDPISAVIMMSGIYYGSMYGGTITSVLINTPGESATIVTTLDGYQMAKQGRGGVALGIATIGSFVAGTFGTMMLMVMGPLLAKGAMKFGPAEYCALTLLGLATLMNMGGGSPLKALISGLVGLILGTVGMDVMVGGARFTFGVIDMLNGFDFLPISIALFGFSEILMGRDEADAIRQNQMSVRIRDTFPSLTDWAQSRWAIVRGTLIGFFIGILPGAGATIASFIAYFVEKRVSKTPERFGKGAIEGVAGPESANNAASAGSLVPLLTLGLPGGTTTAVLLGAFIMWGLRPGPLLFQQSPKFVWGLIASMYIGNIMLVLLNIFLIPIFVRMLRVPYHVLMPSIVFLCVLGAYSANNRMFDVGVMLVFGVLGYLMKKLDYSPAAFVPALVLGPMFENSFRQALTISDGSFATFVTRPISATLLAFAALTLLWPVIKWLHTRATRKAAPPGQVPAT